MAATYSCLDGKCKYIYFEKFTLFCFNVYIYILKQNNVNFYEWAFLYRDLNLSKVLPLSVVGVYAKSMSSFPKVEIRIFLIAKNLVVAILLLLL